MAANSALACTNMALGVHALAQTSDHTELLRGRLDATVAERDVSLDATLDAIEYLRAMQADDRVHVTPPCAR